MRILGVNGIRTDGSATTDRLLNQLSAMGWNTIDVPIPYCSLLQSRSRSRQEQDAKILFNLSRPGDVVVAHSRGALVVLRAMEMGAKFSTVIFFGGAMNDDFTFPYLGMDRLYNLFNASDRALKLGDLLIWHDFGLMGQHGYKGAPDPRIKNIDAPLRQPLNAGQGLHHSEYFKGDNTLYWAEQVELWLMADGHIPDEEPVSV